MALHLKLPKFSPQRWSVRRYMLKGHLMKHALHSSMETHVSPLPSDSKQITCHVSVRSPLFAGDGGDRPTIWLFFFSTRLNTTLHMPGHCETTPALPARRSLWRREAPSFPKMEMIFYIDCFGKKILFYNHNLSLETNLEKLGSNLNKVFNKPISNSVLQRHDTCGELLFASHFVPPSSHFGLSGCCRTMQLTKSGSNGFIFSWKY